MTKVRKRGEGLMSGRYHYTECGLDDVYLANGFKITKDKSGDEHVFINDVHDLHKAIGIILVSKPSRLCGKEIKFIRHTLDLSQKMLAKLLGVSYQSILGWEKDKTKIQKPTEHLLRALFFAYLNTDESRAIYDKINEIADLDAEDTLCTKSEGIVFKEVSDEWKRVA